MILDFEPGDKVVNPLAREWGIGQVQSIIKEKITVNFQNVGKKVINSNNIELKFNDYEKVHPSCSNGFFIHLLFQLIIS